MPEGKHPVPPPPADRLEVSLSGPLGRAPAAVEYRTIPPTINVRYKQRPPPLRLLSRRPSDVGAHSPVLPNTATTASSFSSFPASASTLATSAPPESAKWSFSASLSTFPETPYTPLSPTSARSGTVQIADALSPPPDPEAYLRERPWDFAEYLLLLGIATVLAPSHPSGWVLVTAKFNSSTLGRAPRSSWECFHRCAVPWLAKPGDVRACGTYPHVAGVQHTYEHVHMQDFIDDYLAFVRALGHGVRIPKPRPAQQTRINPNLNVPSGTLGHTNQRGSSPWFQTAALHTTIERILDRSESPGAGLPPHLYRTHVPPSSSTV
ncbi:unnamed protein product [Peniophora sp. CBMAI 1063]|nr:unnamed protein product [Peniophora sp. CBMAI 1063]